MDDHHCWIKNTSKVQEATIELSHAQRGSTRIPDAGQNTIKQACMRMSAATLFENG